ncbi:MAG: TOBE domain-containing protein, partial [Acetobacteraceae bacterium]|nr:TOBE domain-containing protein [Acetobacteraceae bacterium]
LSNLDAKLRVQMRAELKRFHHDLNATIIYVTHDQLEAVTMADRMAVMNGGLLQQYDTPENVFETPINLFVAGFVGSPAMNLIPAQVTNGGALLESPQGWRCKLSPANARKALTASGPGLVLGARHSTLILSSVPVPDAIEGRVYTLEPTGDITFVHVRLGHDTVVVSVAPGTKLVPNAPVWLGVDQTRLHLFDAITGMALRAA